MCKENSLWLLMLGPIWAAIYYSISSFAIHCFNLMMSGREVETASVKGARSASGGKFVLQLVRAFGGQAHILSLDACTTRLRVRLANIKKPVLTHPMRSEPPGVAIGGGDFMGESKI